MPLNILNKFGKKWIDFWNTPTTILYAHNPYEVVSNHGPHKITERRGDAAKQAVTAVAAPLLGIGLLESTTPTLIGVGTGAVSDYIGNKTGKKAAELLGGDLNAQEMVGDITGAVSGTVGGAIGGIYGDVAPLLIKSTSLKTLGNRLAHPIESLKFGRIYKKVENVLGKDWATRTYNAAKKTKYKNNADDLQFSYNKNANEYNINGLKSSNHPDNWSRSHELGHSVSQSLRSDGYEYNKWTPNDGSYTYIDPTHDSSLTLTRLSDEMFADSYASKLYKPEYAGENNMFINRYNRTSQEPIDNWFTHKENATKAPSRSLESLDPNSRIYKTIVNNVNAYNRMIDAGDEVPELLVEQLEGFKPKYGIDVSSLLHKKQGGSLNYLNYIK